MVECEADAQAKPVVAYQDVAWQRRDLASDLTLRLLGLGFDCFATHLHTITSVVGYVSVFAQTELDSYAMNPLHLPP